MSEKWPGIIQQPMTVVLGAAEHEVRDARGRTVCKCQFAPDAYFIASQLTSILRQEEKRQRGLWFRFVRCLLRPIIDEIRYK